ncbi:MAG: hypothetical protein HY682_12665 [Chloroflexi bacterium]|nr:hypothetical protein [Chloroflexota bacterium]
MRLWYVAKSKPGKERILATELARYDVETFYPYLRKVRGGDARLEALFPTYMFCRFDPLQPDWQAIRWAHGLAYFLQADDELATVPEPLIEYLKDKTLRWNQGSTQSRFKPGERVRIVNGPFTGFEAIFRSYIPSRERCQVLLQAIKTFSTVEVPERDLDSISTSWRTRFAAQAE